MKYQFYALYMLQRDAGGFTDKLRPAFREDWRLFSKMPGYRVSGAQFLSSRAEKPSDILRDVITYGTHAASMREPLEALRPIFISTTSSQRSTTHAAFGRAIIYAASADEAKFLVIAIFRHNIACMPASNLIELYGVFFRLRVLLAYINISIIFDIELLRHF